MTKFRVANKATWKANYSDQRAGCQKARGMNGWIFRELWKQAVVDDDIISRVAGLVVQGHGLHAS